MIKNLPAKICLLLVVSLAIQACKKIPGPVVPPAYAQVNLVANISSFGAAKIDSNLVNAWGLAFSPTGALWSTNNGTGTSTVYDKGGNMLLPYVNIPSPDSTANGAPTGIVFNTTTDFKVSNIAATFIAVNEDGIISAWLPGTKAAVTVADRSFNSAIYKGVAIATVGVNNFLYACNFYTGRIDVFDGTFNYLKAKQLIDPTIPAGFAPFNIQNIGNMLYVMYARQIGPYNHDDQNGVGNGYISIFKPDGTFVKRFASNGTLNSPWGIAQAPAAFGLGANAILIGNFGDGKINVFDANGVYKSQLNSQAQLATESTVISIDGLWGLAFQNSNGTGGDPTKLYFTSGPNGTVNGLLGYLRKK